MSEWKKAPELAKDFGVTLSAIYMWCEAGEERDGYRFERRECPRAERKHPRQKWQYRAVDLEPWKKVVSKDVYVDGDGNQYPAKAVEEALTNYEAKEIEFNHPEPKHKWPKPPLTIVVDEDAGVEGRLARIEQRIETLSKVAWDASLAFNRAESSRSERRDVMGRIEAMERRIEEDDDFHVRVMKMDDRLRVLENQKIENPLADHLVGKTNRLEAQLITLKSEVQDLQSQLDQLSLRKLVLKRSK